MHEFCFALGWEGMTPEGWAAWVQAVGTVAVFAWAVWIHFSEKRHTAEREADLREREADLREKGTQSEARKTLQRFDSMFGWLSEMGANPNTRWRDMGDPFGQFADDPGASALTLGVAGESFDEFIAKCLQASKWCQAMALQDPNDQDRDSDQAKQTLAKVQEAIEAGRVLRAKLYELVDIEPAPARRR